MSLLWEAEVAAVPTQGVSTLKPMLAGIQTPPSPTALPLCVAQD